MDGLKKIIAYFETHPLVLALTLVAGFFVYFRFIKQPATTSTATTPTTATPTTAETYNQQYNSYPSGGTVTTPVTTTTTPVTTPKTGAGGGTSKTPPPKVLPKPAPTPVVKSVAKYITVKQWPDQLSTLSGIASYARVSLSTVENLNPQYKGNYNLIYAGQQVRVA
jgi:hypothetical protein